MTAPARATILRVAYQGVAGAFGEEAVHRLWPDGASARPARTFSDALSAVANGDADRAVIPTWNSSIGRVDAACAALDARAATIVRDREIDVPVRHCLLALPGTSIDGLRYVGSHPAALAQCAGLFGGAHGLVACDAFDTAGAALELSRYGERAPPDAPPWYAGLDVDHPGRLAAIASAGAARHYGLVVLRHDVQDDRTNLTRFVAVRASDPDSSQLDGGRQ